MNGAGALVAATMIGAGALLPAGAFQQPLRSGIDNVPVYVTVTDRNGRLVDGLEVDDFEIYDNGRRQSVSLYGRGIQPITVAILLDRSPSLFGAATRTKDAITAFTERLIPKDRAVLGTFGHTVSLVPTLTEDRDALVGHLADDVPFPAGTALWDAIDAGRMALADEGGRRVILIVTDAADNCSRVDLTLLRNTLEREGVLLYAIGVRGREGLPLAELGALVRRTGGWYAELKPSDDVGRTMQRVADELHRQYMMAFTPQLLDNKVHRIEVKVRAGLDGLTVRARRSYVATSHGHPR